MILVLEVGTNGGLSDHAEPVRAVSAVDRYISICHHMANFCMTDQKCAFEAVVVLFASIYLIYFTLARTRRDQGSRWGVKTFNSCTLPNLAQVMPSSLSSLSIHFNLWDKNGHQEIQVYSACCFPPQLSCMWAQWKRNLHGNLLDTRTARPRCQVQRGSPSALGDASMNFEQLENLDCLSNSIHIQVEYCTSFYCRIGSPYIICKNGIDLRVGHGWTPRIPPKLDTWDALHAPVHRRSEGNPGQCRRQAKAQW